MEKLKGRRVNDGAGKGGISKGENLKRNSCIFFTIDKKSVQKPFFFL